MSVKGIAVIAAVGLLTLPALAGAASQLTATNVRIGDHAAYVRVVVDFNGTVPANEVEFVTLTNTMATLRLNHPGVTTWTSGGTGDGVSAALQPATQGLNIAVTFAPHRLKYVSYAVVTGTRLAIDFWKSTPPARPVQTCSGLSLTSWHVKPGLVALGGSEHRVFENQFEVVVRGAKGRVLGRKANVFGPGAWSTHVRYTAAHAQTGTLEVVALSAKDGALECLAQRRVALPAS